MSILKCITSPDDGSKTNHNFRRKRRSRRRNRYTEESRTLWMYATITIMSLASLLVSLAKVLLKFSEEMFGSLNLFLLAGALLAFGVLVLWGVYQRGSLLNSGVIALGSLLAVSGSVYIATGDYEEEFRQADPLNPWEFKLPEVTKTPRVEEPQFMMIIGKEKVGFDRFNALLSEEDTPDTDSDVLNAALEKAMERAKRERKLLNGSYEIRVGIAADQCTEFGRLNGYQDMLGKSGMVMELAVTSPKGNGVFRLPSPTEAETHEPALVALLPNRVEIQTKDMEATKILECQSTDCYSQACDEPKDFSQVAEILSETDAYSIKVHPQVSMQSLVGLIDSLSTLRELYPVSIELY